MSHTSIYPAQVPVLAESAAFWVSGALLALALVYFLVYRNHFSSIRYINGPQPTSFIFGNVIELFTKDSTVFELQWSRAFGGIFSTRWAFGETRLYVSDPAALHHILVTECYSYPKPDQLRHLMSGALGQGLLFAEGEDHRRQRKVVGPAFSAAATKQYANIFNDKAKELCESWMSQLYSRSEAVINVSEGVARCTTDIIGIAGFNHSFDSIASGESALVRALNTVVGCWDDSMLGVLQRSLAVRFPGLLKFASKLPVRRAIAMKACFSIIEKELGDIFDATAYHHDDHAKDFISSILKANSKTVKAKDRLSEVETKGQVATVAIAGLETTATAITWALYELSINAAVQARLREEVRATIDCRGECTLSDDDLSRMPYLDAFVREVLRFYPPIDSTLREPAKDDLIPLSEPHLCRDGKTYITHVPVKKGQRISIGILGHNRNKAIWGEDADVFRPERWLEMDEGTGEMGGPRGCVGYRFAVREIKTIISVLLDSLRFEPRDEDTVVLKRTTFVARPLIQGEEKLGNQLPLKVSLAPSRD
ncbi:cytochrome P450 [Cystobasidium minutum MCA 4210]|uniref:cytochrome P450 n=1 Tax=Cystobasidium minutum MCA 4210 TaxID=1397322 RepID=UPI0034CE7EE4|eukprot:jgi/Rhomi1/213366/estExt_Genemark1.C_110053